MDELYLSETDHKIIKTKFTIHVSMPAVYMVMHHNLTTK